MSKAYRSMLHLGLSKSGVALLQTSGWLRTRAQVLGEMALSEADMTAPEVLQAKLSRLLTETHCSRRSVRVVLSDDWVRHWMVSPPENASRLADCAAAAAARFQVLFGEAPAAWQIAADWDARKPFLACAVPLPLLNVLQQVAQEHRLVLLEVAPQFVVAWNRWRAHLRAGAWLGVIHERRLSVAPVSRHGLEAVREVLMPDSQDQLPRMLVREALRLNVPRPMEIMLCGQVPGRWSMQEMESLSFARLGQFQLDGALGYSAGVSLAATGVRS